MGAIEKAIARFNVATNPELAQSETAQHGAASVAAANVAAAQAGTAQAAPQLVPTDVPPRLVPAEVPPRRQIQTPAQVVANPSVQLVKGSGFRSQLLETRCLKNTALSNARCSQRLMLRIEPTWMTLRRVVTLSW